MQTEDAEKRANLAQALPGSLQLLFSRSYLGGEGSSVSYREIPVADISFSLYVAYLRN